MIPYCFDYRSLSLFSSSIQSPTGDVLRRPHRIDLQYSSCRYIYLQFKYRHRYIWVEIFHGFWKKNWKITGGLCIFQAVVFFYVQYFCRKIKEPGWLYRRSVVTCFQSITRPQSCGCVGWVCNYLVSLKRSRGWETDEGDMTACRHQLGEAVSWSPESCLLLKCSSGMQTTSRRSHHTHSFSHWFYEQVFIHPCLIRAVKSPDMEKFSSLRDAWLEMEVICRS